VYKSLYTGAWPVNQPSSGGEIDAEIEGALLPDIVRDAGLLRWSGCFHVRKTARFSDKSEAPKGLEQSSTS